MPNEGHWLRQTMGINEGCPYQSALVHACYEQRQTLGIVILHVENGTVRFEFHIDPPVDHARYQSLLQAVAEAMQGAQGLDIVVPSANLRHAVLVTTLPTGGPYSGGPFRGILAERAGVPASSFGTADQPMDRVVVKLLDIPSDWGDRKSTYQYANLRSPLKFSEDEKHILIPTDMLGVRALSGCTINAGGWTVEVQEIPSERRDNPRVTHWCAITKSNGRMTGTSAWKFFNEELWPFVCFMFAHKVQVAHMTGVGWTKLQAVRPEIVQTYGANWLLPTRSRRINLQSLFQEFHHQTAQTKKHWRKVIDRYATSEEIIATIGDPETAEAVSFAGLDGLVRSIISGYSDKDQWLNRKLELEPKFPKKGGGKVGIKDAVELVLKRELATNNPELTESLSRLAKLRNSTAHTDLQSAPDWSNAYHRWNASQALIEILLLSKMGLEEIPNRTQYPTFAIMGLDVYKDVRGETILPHRCQSCGEWTGTLTHEECKQNLCSPCWERHNRSGCTDAVYTSIQ